MLLLISSYASLKKVKHLLVEGSARSCAVLKPHLRSDARRSRQRAARTLRGVALEEIRFFTKGWVAQDA